MGSNGISAKLILKLIQIYFRRRKHKINSNITWHLLWRSSITLLSECLSYDLKSIRNHWSTTWRSSRSMRRRMALTLTTTTMWVVTKKIFPTNFGNEWKVARILNITMTQAADYWASVPTTIDGMLGGFAKISHTDIDGSNKLLKSLFKVDKAWICKLVFHENSIKQDPYHLNPVLSAAVRILETWIW